MFRAACERAARIHEMRAAMGVLPADYEESAESEAGSLLIAEHAHDTHQILLDINGYLEAVSKANG